MKLLMASPPLGEKLFVSLLNTHEHKKIWIITGKYKWTNGYSARKDCVKTGGIVF